MRFVDSASVMVEAGKGGRGCLTAIRAMHESMRGHFMRHAAEACYADRRPP